ncbi:MAG: AI-2E family transporter [Christensenellaceae bacterium]|nr:AI-2E family transporter [Christensenellaceae bacterium]
MDVKLSKKNIRVIMLLLLFTFSIFRFDVVSKIITDIFFILTPFLIGAVMALIVNLPMSFMENKLRFFSRSKFLLSLRRPICLTVSLLLVLAVIVALFVIIIPEVTRAIERLIAVIPGALKSLMDWISEQSIKLHSNIEFIELPSQSDVRQYIDDAIKFILGGIGSSTVIITSAASVFMDFVIGVVFAVYLLYSKENIRVGFRTITGTYLKPKVALKAQKLANISIKTFSDFMGGQIIQSIISALLTWIVLAVFQIPYSTLIAMLVFITAFIPLFGPYISGVAGAILIFSIDGGLVPWFLLLFLVIQQISGSVIYPRIMRNAINLPSVWVLVSVTVGGGFMGIVGMLFFVPLVAILYQIVLEDIAARKSQKMKAKTVSHV